MMVAGSIFFFALATTVVVLEMTQPTHGSLVIVVLCVAFGVAMSLLCLRSALRLRDRIAANNEGIWHLPHSGDVTFIAWDAAGRLRANDTEQRLIVYDSTSDKKIKLEYQLENFWKATRLCVKSYEIVASG